jgi:hypothetical protein
MVRPIARNATIVYVQATNFNDAAQGAIDQNLAAVMSESLGTCEPAGAMGNRAMAQQTNAQGNTWLVSSGDSGGAGGLVNVMNVFSATSGLGQQSPGLPAEFFSNAPAHEGSPRKSCRPLRCPKALPQTSLHR